MQYISFMLPTIIVFIIFVRYFGIGEKLNETKDALNRSRDLLKSEREYVQRLEQELLKHNP